MTTANAPAPSRRVEQRVPEGPILPERSPQPSRSAEREATSRGGGAPRHSMTSEGSEPSGALSPERWGWGPTALLEERGEH